MNRVRHLLRARRVARHRRTLDELQLVIFWSELRKGSDQ